MKKMIVTALLVLLVSCIITSHVNGLADDKEYVDSGRFEATIQKFELGDKTQFPPQDAIVCVGSSSMVGWNDTIQDDLAPLTVIPRGFGGSNMNDALYYADRVVLVYKPRAVVLYEGDNDIADGIAPEKIVATFRKFVEKIYLKLPECRIYILSIKPSISRWSLWPEMKRTNSLLAAECKKDARLIYVDVASPMLDDTGNPRKNVFLKDDLHMNRDGYVIWRDVLRPILLDKELQFEMLNEGH